MNDPLTSKIIQCSYQVMNELGPGFLEKVYQNALGILLTESNLFIDSEVEYKIVFRGQVVGFYKADLVVNKSVLVELKTVSKISNENKAQVINYLAASGIQTGLLINFGLSKVEVFRLQNPSR